MDRLTIGAFARACGLTPKALRLYDELGLLRPAEVDPLSGYRFYAPEQLDRARLVAHLRRIGLPLARIQPLCELTPRQAAAELGAYWDGVLADTAARQDLVTLLLDHLTGSTGMNTTLGLRYAAAPIRAWSGPATRTPPTRTAGCWPSRTASADRRRPGPRSRRSSASTRPPSAPATC